jgi:hypothetical protein
MKSGWLVICSEAFLKWQTVFFGRGGRSALRGGLWQASFSAEET